ncbi:hypothetical protein D081_1915 [Anaerovibrio sp. JC8]|uniref:hypothetical protein n=1 Tax=Anaerovibrio sp. JC8 TaxID=1240085 RepID=UPI000A0E3A1B|nr:hypothetical protein [Anaerovibrio sp. JC8]ORT99363.1 hypothetical protein D081_1915 [Anaerovibrio sp. JC8]
MTDKDNPYADIIDLPRPVSKKHPPLTMEQRAAQFAPFAAVNGHNEAITKTAMAHEKGMKHQ